MSTLEIIFWILLVLWIVVFISSIISIFIEDLKDRQIPIYLCIYQQTLALCLLVITLFL